MADKSKVNVGKPYVAGGIWRAPVGTTLPTDATTALGSSFTSVGYISEDGVTWSYSGDTEDYRAWGGDVVHSEVQDTEDTAQFVMIESTNTEAVKAFWGDSAVTTNSSGYAVAVGEPDTTRYAWVMEMALQGGGKRRIVIPEGFVSERGEITYSDSELVGYDVTIQADRDASGKYHYEYVKLSA